MDEVQPAGIQPTAVVSPNTEIGPRCSVRAFAILRDAAIIGEVQEEHPGRVVMKTRLGTSRIVDMLVGEPLPRIC